MLQYALNRSKRQNKEIETYSKVEGWIDEFNMEYNDDIDASVYKKDDFEEILSESEEDNFSETEDSEYYPSDSEDDYSEYDQLETESVETDSVEENYEDLSDEYLSDGDSDYDPETDSYEYSDSMESDLESVDDLENIEYEYEKTFTNLEMNAIIEKLELNRKKELVDMMFLTSMLILMIICGFTYISLIKTN